MPVLALNVLKNNNPINFARAIPYNRQRPVCSLEDDTVKLGNKERFDKEQIGIKEPFPVTNLPFTS